MVVPDKHFATKNFNKKHNINFLKFVSLTSKSRSGWYSIESQVIVIAQPILSYRSAKKLVHCT